jgi:hypothetical protein
VAGLSSTMRIWNAAAAKSESLMTAICKSLSPVMSGTSSSTL